MKPTFLFLIILLASPAFAQRPAESILEGYFREGYELMQAQEFDQALEKFDRHIRESGLTQESDYFALYFRAVCNYYLENFKMSIEDIDRYVTRFSASPQPYLLRATCYRHLGDEDAQLRDLNEGLSRKPEEDAPFDPELFRWRASILVNREQYDSALTDIRRALDIREESETYSMLAFVQYNQGRYDSALMAVNKGISINHSFVSSYIYGSMFCLQEEDNARALVYADLGLRVDDREYRLWFHRGIALVELNNIDKGCSALNKAFYNGVDEAGDYLSEFCYKIE